MLINNITSKVFIIKILLILFSLLITIVSINYYFNDYGLFGDVNGEEKRIYMDEKESKYLLSLNYVPSNFDAILVGPSLSDHIKTKNITAYDIYNLSIAGGNISEIKPLVQNVSERGNLNFVLFCLDPYLTKDYGLKSLQIIDNPKLTTLFSLKAIKINLKKIYFYIFPHKDKFLDSEWGHNRIIIDKNHDSAKEINKRVVQIQNDSYHIKVEKKALEELSNTVLELRKQNIKTLFYFHPVPYEIYSQKNYNDEYQDYRSKTISAIGQTSIIIDMNNEKYNYIRKDYRNYLDSGHLSEKGLVLVTDVLNSLIKENVEVLK